MFRRALVRSLAVASRLHNKPLHQASLQTRFLQRTRLAATTAACTHTEREQPKHDGPLTVSADCRADSKRLSVKFTDGEENEYPYVWLRDNCQCPTCFHPFTKARLVLMKDLDINIEPKNVQIQDGGQRIEVTWPDGHVSPYQSTWLSARAFNLRARAKRDEIYGRKHVKWGAEMKDKLQYYDYEKVMTDDATLLAWLTQMETYGISMLVNALEKDCLFRLGDRVGQLRRTNYGETFEVMNKENPSNLAYTTAALGLHCDLPFYGAIPGIQFLHFVVNEAKGGANHFADAANAGDQLREQRPDLYKLLSETLVDFNDIGHDAFSFHLVYQHPIIRHDYQGNVIGYAYSNQVRDSYMNVPVEKVWPMYGGLKMINEIMYDPKNRIDVEMKTGHIVVFDNIQVLHGRSEYGGGHRHLMGVYMDWCDVRSKIRLLRAQLE